MNSPRKIECPNCGAPVFADARDRNIFRCEYCGTVLSVDAPVIREKETVIYKEATVYKTVYRSPSPYVREPNKDSLWYKYWHNTKAINPDYQEKRRLPLKTGAIVWLVFLGVSALTFLGVFGIL